MGNKYIDKLKKEIIEAKDWHNFTRNCNIYAMARIRVNNLVEAIENYLNENEKEEDDVR